MYVQTPKLKETTYLTGLIMLLVSLVIFILPLVMTPFAEDTPSAGMFIANYAITAFFIAYLLFAGKLRRGRNGLHEIMLFLILFLVSAYSLNREMNVFDDSVTWFIVLLVAICINYIAFIFFEQLPVWAKYLLCFTAGVAMIVFLYLAVYLFPLYIISALIFFGLGISLHSFVPVLFCIYTVVLIRRVNGGAYKFWKPFIAGMAISVLLTTGYGIAWNTNVRAINDSYRYADITANDQLPSWVLVAQQIPKNDFTKKILKTGLVYSVRQSDAIETFFWRMPRMSFEKKVHDPLVVIGSLFSGNVNLPEDDRIKILKAEFNSRHQAQERLRSGDDLTTEHVSTKVKIWPAFRMSYSELSLTISHEPDKSSWANSQEAIYTFHLPEGAVATSLSLWINGQEEKGILTTKSKADSAYKTIVGVESRDPSLVHWQEGNTLSVRVFPILKGQNRKFKIGITAPLSFDGKKLTYRNIYFDGPPSLGTGEDVLISTEGNMENVTVPAGFEQSQHQFSKSGNYSPDWSLSFSAPALSNEAFNFENHSYTLGPVSQEAESFDPSQIFLDINSSWTKDECEKVYALVRNKKVYVSEGEESFTQIDEANKQRIFDKVRKNSFSLFPFFKIDDPERSLVITKSGAVSPNIDDLRGGKFLEQTNTYFTHHRAIKLYDLGNELSPYLKSLKEFRVFQYDKGDEEKLAGLLAQTTFFYTIENDDTVAIQDAGIAVHRADAAASGQAPDHLMRLFAYNHILQRSGRSLLAETPGEEAVIAEAQEAYVVSPFSSLVVLETQSDYDRFNITTSEKSLQNASLKSKGAVPEPHEWALIILVVLLCAVIKFRPKLLMARK